MARPPPRGTGRVWTLRSFGTSTSPRRGAPRMSSAVNSQEMARGQANSSRSVTRGPRFPQAPAVEVAGLLEERAHDRLAVVGVGPRPRLERAGLEAQRHLG